MRSALINLAVLTIAVTESLPANGGPVSDDFNGSSLNTSVWTAVAPAGGKVSLNSGHVLLAVPAALITIPLLEVTTAFE